MFRIEEFMEKLDDLYRKRRVFEIESCLKNGIGQALKQQDEGAALVLLNELMGYYHSISCHDACKQCAKQALGLVVSLGLEETVNHGTTLLNAATGLRAAGEYAQAEEYYQKAASILETQLPEGDYRLASLYNNMSLLCMATDRLEPAKICAEKALQTIGASQDTAVERAISLSNLGSIYSRLGQTGQAKRALEQAVQLFESQPGGDDPHYPAALSGLAEVCFHRGELDRSAAFYRRALEGIEQTYGRNDDWQITRRNLDAVEELQARRAAIAGKSGMELARAFYEQAGRPMLREKYPEYVNRIAVGLAGEGSECMGFDDAFSVDHDFGPGFCLWLTKEDYEAIGSQLQADYRALADRWRGFPARNVTPEGENRVGVMEIDSFFHRFTGHSHAPEADTLQDVMDWNAIPQERLAAVVSGQVFEDPLGQFTRRRASFSRYPEPVRLYRLGQTLGRMAQAGQYNYLRAKNRNDVSMMYACLAEFISAAQETAYLLEGRYMPFYKWRQRGMRQLKQARELIPLLEDLMRRAPDEEQVAEGIEAVCAWTLTRLREQGLTDCEDPFLERHKTGIFKRVNQMLQTKAIEKAEQAARESAEKNARIEAIVAEEWRQFQNVHNEGGRASCQDDPETFSLMRKSQFSFWSKEVLDSYWQDLMAARDKGWNLLTEKYARMMEHTAPAQYEQLADLLPQRSPDRLQLQELVVSIFMDWTRTVEQKYPNLMGKGRSLSSAQDGPWNVSSETYLRGELSTYSDETFRLYAQMVLQRLDRGENLVEQNMTCMVQGYGYPDLQAADYACARRQRN